jgi:thiol-disulfide isomerase/thioredoxin
VSERPTNGRRLPVSFWISSVIFSAAVALLIAWFAVGRPADDGTVKVQDLLDASAKGVTVVDGAQATIGQPAPKVTFDYLADEHQGSLADFAGKPMVINFWGATCAPCVREMPLLETVHQQLGDRIAIVGMDVSDSVESGRKMVERTGVTYPSGRDPRAQAFSAFGGTVQPFTVFIRADGTVAYTHSGAFDDAAQLTSLITEHLG